MAPGDTTAAETMRAYIDAWNDHDIDAILAYFADDQGGEWDDQRLRSVCEEWFTAFPDLRHEIKELVTDGEWVLGRLVLHGTHDGPFHGLPPTGTEIEVSDYFSTRFNDGEIVEHHATADYAGLYHQLGVTIPPESTREERNKAVVREYFQALNDRDREAFLATMAEDFTYGDIEGPEAMADSDWRWIEAMDLTWELDAVRADGDMVMTRGTARGTHTGEIKGLEPTGEDWEIAAMTWSHLTAEGLIDAWWGMWEFASMLDQLGVLDAPVYGD